MTTASALGLCTQGAFNGTAHDPRDCGHGDPQRITVGADQNIRVGDRRKIVGRVIDADKIIVGSNVWVQSCDEFYAWHIDGTTAWGMCRQGDHGCCAYSLERVLGRAPFHAR